MAAATRRLPLQRHPWFDAWAYPKGCALHDLAAEIAARLDRDEEARGTRARRRRNHVEHEREVSICIVVANLSRLVLDPGETARLAVVLGKTRLMAKRYRSPASGRLRTALLDQLEHLELVHIARSKRRGEASSIAPTASFAALCRGHRITLADFGRVCREETIVARPRRDTNAGSPPALLDYPETGETEGMRAVVVALNAHIAQADIAFLGDHLGPVNAHERHQRRLFNGPPDDPLQGNGRLYGGFWQNLKRERRRGLRINGEETVVADYSSMFVRLAYARLGVTPPAGDLYVVPGLEKNREAVKVLTSTLFFDQRQRSSWPKDEGLVVPSGWPLPKARAAIFCRHPVLRSSFGRGLGHELMRLESDIMLAVLDQLREKGVVALNLHDGLIVAAGDAMAAQTMMLEIGQQRTGAHLPVVIKHSSGAASVSPASPSSTPSFHP
ncbi:hypothetical protein ABE438_04975 [Bosea sp. TWI1241]|uniref:hypothetical protein n=1 Tax=Bosea sp. TWI1241 TaxID=3148904 RepID=UPI003207FE93